jgi:hypothetical protein
LKWFNRHKKEQDKKEVQEKPNPKNGGLKGWYSGVKKKRLEKKEQQRISEPTSLKIITASLTLVAMALGMSLLPLFPQPLPIIIAILVGFVAFRDPRFGMPIGGAVIGFGLIYHLADLYFFSFLGAENIRIAIIVVWMALFIALPVIFQRYKSALAIDFGILAFVSLFSTQTYFLAIPLILASAVFFKKQVGLTIVYYVLLTVPLQIIQYFKYTVAIIVAPQWWLEPGSAPPVFVPLNSILADLNTSMSQFRLYDASQAVYTITGQLTWTPNFNGRTLTDALIQYRDSVPGILMFVVIVAGLSLALVFFSRMLVSQGSGSFADRLIPCFIATCAAAFFFIFLSALQTGLAFTANVSGGTMVFGILATLLFTFPSIFMSNTPKQTTSNSEITDKAQALMSRLQVFEDQLNNVKTNIPVVVSSPEGKLLIIKDSLEDTLKKFAEHYYEPAELNEKFQELKKFNKNVDELELELTKILSEYQIFANCELSNWIGKLKATGLKVDSSLSVDFQNDVPLEQRIEDIRKTLEESRNLAKNVLGVAEPVYGVIRPLYDPSLPEKNGAIEFAKQKLMQKESPWIAIEALHNALNNWKRQYGTEILASMRYLQSSLTPIANLSGESEVLQPIFRENLPKVLGYAEKAETMKLALDKSSETDQLNILDVVTLKDDVESVLSMAEDLLSMLYGELISDDKTIERLLPTEDYPWEKNSNLDERLKKVTETLANPLSDKINQIMEHLPTYLSYVDETVQTLVVYNERKEFLLNYPLAATAIEQQLKQKKQLSAKDLPFQPKFAGEYLRLYYLQRFNEFNFDKENMQLTKKT